MGIVAQTGDFVDCIGGCRACAETVGSDIYSVGSAVNGGAGNVGCTCRGETVRYGGVS